MITVDVDLREVLRRINSPKVLAAAKAGLKAGAAHIEGKIKPYPAASEANSPANDRWYERGFGSRWKRKDGSIGGRKSSETLGRRWTIKAKNNGLTVMIGNNASYAPFVHDKDKQAAFHQRRGWKTAQDVVKDEADEVKHFVEAQISEAMSK